MKIQDRLPIGGVCLLLPLILFSAHAALFKDSFENRSFAGFNFVGNPARIANSPAQLGNYSSAMSVASGSSARSELRHSDPAPDDPLPDPKADAKHRELLAMLTQEPGIHYSFATGDEREPDNVILAIAIRGKGTCEVRIPKSQYDGIAELELIERLTGICKM